MVLEYVARWRGGRIGAGASVFHFGDPEGPQSVDAIPTAVRALFVAFQGSLPDEVNIEFDSEVRELDLAGNLTGVSPVTAPASVNGTSTLSWSQGMGSMIRWNTGQVVAGRRLVGRTFIAPRTNTAFTTSGDVTPGTITSDGTAIAAFLTALSNAGSPLVIWSRTGQVTAPVQNGATQSRPSYLRSRNDRSV